MLGTFEAGLFPGANYYLSWFVPFSHRLRVVPWMSYLSFPPTILGEDTSGKLKVPVPELLG